MKRIIDSRYEVIRDLDPGRENKIYLCRDLQLDQDVVLKSEKLASFGVEPYILKNLNHKFLPKVYGLSREGDTYYTAIDYVEGESLDKALRKNQQFSSAQIVKWAKEVLEALVYLHGPPNGILHCDIKPANIMLTPQGDTRLIDFNISLALDPDGAVAIGHTPGYASPEHYGEDYSTDEKKRRKKRFLAEKTILLSDNDTVTVITNTDSMSSSSGIDSSGGKYNPAPVSTGSSKKTYVLDARSDIYSLGATIYHLITGQKPPPRVTDVEPLTRNDCPPGLAEIINKAMKADRNERYQSADEMLEAFICIHKNDPRAKRFRTVCFLASSVMALMLATSSVTAIAGYMGKVEDDNIAVQAAIAAEKAEAEAQASEAAEKAKAAEAQRVEETIRAKDKAMQANAEASQNALSRGDVTKALDLASTAAQIGTGNDPESPPISAAAKKAMTDALNVYDLSDGYKPYRSINLPSAPLMADISPDGKTAAFVYAYSVALFDLESGHEKIKPLPTTKSALAEARFLDDNTLVYAGIEGLRAINAQSGIELWRGRPATAICISEDRQTIAAIYRDESFATIYGSNGEVRRTVDFGGKNQYVVSNDIFVNMRDNLFSLSADGRFLAISFDDGSITIYDIFDDENSFDLLTESNYLYFSGGYSGNKLTFSATSPEHSEFVVLDVESKELSEDDCFVLPVQLRIFVNNADSGIYHSLARYIKHLDNSDNEEKIIEFDSNIYSFSVNKGNMLVATEDGSYMFFDANGRCLSKHKRAFPTDITLLSNDFAVVGNRNETFLTVLKIDQPTDFETFKYDFDYTHHEARIYADGSRIMLFSVDGFRIYDPAGNMIAEEKEIPDRNEIRDQQFSKSSGNLAVMYENRLIIYSGQDGKVIFDESGLKSVFYAPYGISILDGKGQLSLVNIDVGMRVVIGNVGQEESFAAFCLMNVTDLFLGERKLIGASKIGEDSYLFVVSDGEVCSVYDQTGTKLNKLFSVPVNGDAEAFFTSDAVIVSPLHGTPAVFKLNDGTKICDLEKDSYLTYIYELDECIVTQYITTDGEIFGYLLDREYQPIASLPRLCDVSGKNLVFDYPQGILRQSRVYFIDELLDIARQRDKRMSS